ncbi:hypothetical protein [Caldivirga sp. UBA161]|uniref:hypothetical protein n=1 Tax=Caldivirga sp. UBA161 TaxID=1915569 RepID=UPI0025BCD8D4|nr:hypothetical protein [Caldivirga sp. UBA161]
MIITVASSPILIPQNEVSVALTPLNYSIIKFIPLSVEYNESTGVLILTESTISSLINEAQSYSSLNFTQAVEFSGFLVLNNKPYLAYGVIEVKHEAVNLTRLIIYISAASPLNPTPQSASPQANQSLLPSSLNGTSEELVNPLNPISPYLGNTTMMNHFLPPGMYRYGGEPYVNASTTVTTTVSSMVNEFTSPELIILLALALISVTLITLSISELRINEDCAINGMRRVINRLNKFLQIYKPDLTRSELLKYISYYTSDRELVLSVISTYERHVYAGEPINCREYNKAVKALIKMIKRM